MKASDHNPEQAAAYAAFRAASTQKDEVLRWLEYCALVPEYQAERFPGADAYYLNRTGKPLTRLAS